MKSNSSLVVRIDLTLSCAALISFFASYSLTNFSCSASPILYSYSSTSALNSISRYSAFMNSSTYSTIDSTLKSSAMQRLILPIVSNVFSRVSNGVVWYFGAGRIFGIIERIHSELGVARTLACSSFSSCSAS